MEKYIKDLNLSPKVKSVLSWRLKITKVSEFEGHNYLCKMGFSVENI